MHKPRYLLAYQGLSALAGLLGWPYFYWHLKSRGRRESFLPRLGLELPPPPPPGRPRLWLHGVSVGEILAALPLVQELQSRLPRAGFIISTGTETGQALARRHFAPLGCLVCYFPLDLPWAVNRYLDRLHPDIFIDLESEIWPNFLAAAHRRRVRLALVNARLSDKSFRRFIKYRRYLIDIINLYEIIAAGSPQDYERFQALGISGHKLHLTGNLKIDRLMAMCGKDSGNLGAGSPRPPLPAVRAALPTPKPGEAEPAAQPCTQQDWQNQLDLQKNPVFLAASTHPGEEETVLEAYRTLRGPYPALLLLLAPRHPERAAEIGRLLNARGLPYHSWSQVKSGLESRRHPVVLIDTIGDLFSLYGLADIVFVGGSLIPHGGQNILEPAAWGLAPIYGPHLTNFRWAQAILETAGAGIMIHDAASLAAAAQNLLDHPDTRRRLGNRARAALTPHDGAARRQAELIVRLVGGEGQGSQTTYNLSPKPPLPTP
jgi:3-deoxy-D-manno-octulosonic-acid transferase